MALASGLPAGSELSGSVLIGVGGHGRGSSNQCVVLTTDLHMGPRLTVNSAPSKDFTPPLITYRIY